MDHKDIADAERNVSQSALVAPLRALSVLGPIFFALIWMAFGFFAFFQIHAWGIEYDRKMAMVERGEVSSETLYVVEIFDENGHQDRNRGRWKVSLGIDKSNRKRYGWDNNIDDLSVGSPVKAYRFGDTYLVPRFDRGGHHWGKWVFLGVGLLPIPVMGSVLLFKTLRRR